MVTQESEEIANLMDTPKHLMATAASKKTAALGNVSLAIVKNDARLWGALAAHKERRYSPKAATPPENKQVTMPGRTPAEAMACHATFITELGRQ